LNNLDAIALRKKADAAHEEALEEERRRQAEDEARRQLPQAKCHALNALQDNDARGALAVVLVEEFPPWLGIISRKPRRTLMAAWKLCDAPNDRRNRASFSKAQFMLVVLLSDGRIGKITQRTTGRDEPYTCYLAEDGEYSQSLVLDILQHDARFRARP
jgi:hypothetical protein